MTPDLIGTIGHINEARPEFAGGRVEPSRAGRSSPPTDGAGVDLPARLRTMADRTWSDPGVGGIVRGGYVHDDNDRALLHEAADEIERVNDAARPPSGPLTVYEIAALHRGDAR